MTKQNSRQKLLDKLSIDLDKAFNQRVQAVKKLRKAFDRNQIAKPAELEG